MTTPWSPPPLGRSLCGRQAVLAGLLDGV